jgi:hypothetical protein
MRVNLSNWTVLSPQCHVCYVNKKRAKYYLYQWDRNSRSPADWLLITDKIFGGGNNKLFITFIKNET